MSAPESPLSSSSLLASLPARPPTPPRDVQLSATDDNDDTGEVVNDALRFLVQGHDEPAITNNAATMTTTTTTPSDVGTTMNQSTDMRGSKSDGVINTSTPKKATASPHARGSSTKKVEFLPYPTFYKIPGIGQSSSPVPSHHQPPVRPSPLGHGTVSKPLKSILKPAADPSPCTPDGANDASALGYFSPQDPEGFRQMLHSILLQLEGPSRDARKDAYMAITGAIKAYNRVPDPQLLGEKMARLTQCLSRDLAWKDPSGNLDSQIVQYALNLTCAILFDQQTSGLFDLDFQAFVIDRSIFVLEQADMAKVVVKGHLHLLCVQRFPRAVFGAGRAERLINVMQNMETRNSMVAARLVIYQRLIERAPTAMLNRIKDWIEHVFHALLSSVADIQRRAIDVCTQMGMLLGHHPQTAKAISELCEKELEEGQTYGDYLNMQLIQMTSDKEKAPLVPEIWVAVVLCFRTKRCPVGKWPKFRDWLLTIQKCLNSSDMAVKRPANIAWNRLVFTVMPDSSTTELLRSMLKVPILAGLERRGASELSQQLRQLSLDSYCNLLHYAMRPELAHDELDLAWDMYVGPILTKVSKTGSKGRNTAFRVLHGLLTKTGGTWNVNAANEHDPIQPADLPRLDVRWVRSRMARFMAVMEPMILASPVMALDTQRAVDSCWRSLMAAIAEAGSQEVKASNELKDAIALAVVFFRRLWASGKALTPDDDNVGWLNRYQSMLELTVESLGPGHFVDDILTKTNTDDIEAAPTPSHRHSKQQPVTCSPFVLLFSLYYDPPLALSAPGTIQTSAIWFLRLLAGAKASTSGLLGLLQRSLLTCEHAPSHDLEIVHGQLWTAIAETAIYTLKMQTTVSPQRDTFVMGVALKSTTNIILSGLRYKEGACQQKVVQLYNAACQSARHVASDGGIVLAVMEPLARLVTEQFSGLSMVAILRLASTMAENGVWPSTRSELDQSRKALWTVSLEPCKMQVFDPFDHVYKFFSRSLESTYQGLAGFKDSDAQLVLALMASLTSFLQRCPSTLFRIAFNKLQRSYAAWADDSQRLVFPSSDSPRIDDGQLRNTQELQNMMNELWSQLLSLVAEKLSETNSQLLEVLEPLLMAGFSSPSKTIVNATIAFWNSSFARQEQLDYPPKLFPVLRARQAQTDLMLPGFPRPQVDVESVNFPAFAESQAPRIIDRRNLASAKRMTARAQPPSAENIFIKQHLAAQGLPRVIRDRRSGSSDPATRPRPDDSQAYFAPVEPTSSSAGPESQLLTEHQQEVKDRQRAHAQAYPELSSSPVMPSSRSHEHISKKLSFVSELRRTENGDIVITPKGAKDGTLFSDDMPSSPTPLGKKRSVSPATDCMMEDDESTEIPSSPPGSPTEVPSSAVRPSAEVSSRSVDQSSSDDAAVVDSTDVEMTAADLDLPSDTALPNAQLQLEEEAAVAISGTALETTEVCGSKHTILRKSTVQPDTPSRIEETVLTSRAHIISTPSDVGTNDSITSRSSRKRKRTADTAHISRKRSSPWNKFKAYITNSQGEEDIEDEIIVAPRSSASPRNTEIVQDTPVEPEAVKEHDGEATLTSSQPTTHEPVAKRKRGRPRKSESQETNISSSAPTTSSKRARSSLSTEHTGNLHAQINDEPVPMKSLVGERASSSTTHESQESSQPAQLPATIEMSSQKKRRRRSTTRAEVELEAEDEAIAPAHDTAENGQVTPSARRIVQPQSILGRLRGILADCKNMILGSQEEERALDDVLFEIRREVHGRAQY